MHEQTLRPVGVAVVDAAVLVGTDVDAVGKQLPVFHGAERILQIDRARADGLDLGAEELHTGLEPLEHEIVMQGLAVGRDLLDALSSRHGGDLLRAKSWI